MKYRILKKNGGYVVEQRKGRLFQWYASVDPKFPDTKSWKDIEEAKSLILRLKNNKNKDTVVWPERPAKNKYTLPNALIFLAISAILCGISWVSLPAGVIVGGIIMYGIGMRIAASAAKGSGDESG